MNTVPTRPRPRTSGRPGGRLTPRPARPVRRAAAPWATGPRRSWRIAAVLLLATGHLPATATETTTFGSSRERTFTSPARDLPASWDVETGENVAWSARLGSETFGGPAVAGGQVFVGTNNEKPRDEAVQGDRGVVMAFDADDGEFLWQAVHDKLAGGGLHDWPLQGVCSTPHVEGDRLYYVSNRGELVAADTRGFRDGDNDGPFTGEARTGPRDADIVWSLDMRARLGVVPHYETASSPLLVGRRLFATTSNGPAGDGSIPAPGAPSFIAVDRDTGSVLWQDASPGQGLHEGQWASPSFGHLAGRDQVLFPGGDGVLYAFDPADGRRLWSFDANAGLAPGRREAFVASAAIAGERVVIGVGRDPERGAGPGRLVSLVVDSGGDREPEKLVARPAWSLQGKSFSRTLSTAAVRDGLVYAADLNGFLHCVDAATGDVLWKHDMFAAVWGSPLVADGKVYLGDEDGDVAVLRAGRDKELLAEINMGDSIYTSPAARESTLYIATRSRLFALARAPRPAASPPTP